MRIKIPFKRSLGIQLAVVFTILFQHLEAQFFDFRWSGEITYSNNKDGFFSGFINANSSYIYGLNSNYAKSPLNKDKQLKLIAYDKITVAEVASVSLKGYPENKGAEETLSTLHYFKTVVQENRILVFWTKLINTDSTKTEELFVESYKVDLEPENALKKVYSVTQKVDAHQSEFALPSIVVASNTGTDRIVIGSELYQPGARVVLRCMVLNSQLSASGEKRIELPARCKEVQNGLIASYELGKDGNLYVRSTVELTRDEQELLKQNEPKSFLALTVLNPVSGDHTTLEMRGENKTITDFNYIVTGNKAKVLGFFGDLSRDPSGIDKQGIFYADLVSDSLAGLQLSYSYFEKTTLNKLFPKSRGGRSKNKDVPSTEEQLNTRFDIESIFPMQDGSMILFFTRKYNYSEITSRSGMDGRNIYKTDFYCEKNNVSAIRISAQGKIQWTSNIERSITYEGTDISDVRVVSKDNKFYVVYGTEPKPSKSSRKKKNDPVLTDNLEYATFDASSGRGKKLDVDVNQEVVLQKDKKLIDPASIRVYDNRFYFHRMAVKQKAVWYVANVLFFPSIYYSVLSGNTKYAKGELGVIHILDKKPDKRQQKRKK